MISFDIHVYYVGEEDNKFKYGKKYLLSYAFNKVEVIEILDDDLLTPLLTITNADQGNKVGDPKSGYPIFGDMRLKDFKYLYDWKLIKRDNRLEELLNNEDETDI